ncbi:MAG TPA: beta-propeller fold lactonase family protein [Acidimicrobiia bacterium]|nr:beta-propeller fold lactonase family protein [Acidimicrobiia bacterium]
MTFSRVTADGTRRRISRPSRFVTLAVGVGLAASTALLTVGTAGASDFGSRFDGHHGQDATGYTYVNDNTAGANTIAGFQRNADGSLTPLSGSPFNAGGAGNGAGLASQGAIQATSDGQYLVAVDAGSSQISVLRVTQNGVPVLVGQPISSGGIKPVSVAISPTGLVYVANSGAGGSGYSGFRLHPDGNLTPIPDSTVTVPDNSGVGDVFFNAFGDHVVGTRTGTSLIDSFIVLPNGRLLAAQGSPFTGQGLGQLGAEFSPANPWQLYVSNAHNGAGLGTVSAYTDSRSGQLNAIGSSPFADGQTAPCWVEISHDGKYLFTVNTGSATISGYAINGDGSLTLIGNTPISGGGADLDARLTPDGKYLLVDGAGHNFVSVFAVTGGNLTELASSPSALPTGAHSSGIVNI